jgi:hypothetical protein
MPAAAPIDDACLNCGHAFGAARGKFCPECGQETTLRAPTLAEFAQQFGGNVIAAEGALWRTLALLFLKPGQLSREYLAGRRRRYVLPLRLYLTISLLALLALRLTHSFEFGATPETAIVFDKASEPNFELGWGAAGPRIGIRDGVFFCEQLPASVCGRLQRRLDLDPKNVARELEQASERFLNHWSSAMFLLVPIFAAWLMLAYLNRRLRYAEHLVFALHLHAFWFAAALLASLPLPKAETAAFFAMPVHAVLASHRFYGGAWWTTLLRNAAVALAYGITLLFALAVVTLWAFWG